MGIGYDLISSELDKLFTDKRLISTVREQLGDCSDFSICKVVTTAFIHVLNNNFTLDSNFEGDAFLKTVTDYLYNRDHIKVSEVYAIDGKANALSNLLDMLLTCNALPRYVNLVSWQYRYTRIVRDILVYLEGSDLTSDIPTLIDIIPVINGVIVRELGSVQPQVLAHILVQLLPERLEKFNYIGRELRDSISINNTLIAREGSIITRDVETLLVMLGIDDFPVKDYSDDARYLMQMRSLRPIQIRVLQKLSYKNKIEVIRHRIRCVCEQDTVAVLTSQLKAFSEYEWQHAYNVTILSALVGVELGLNGLDLDRLIIGALLHDIGKLDLPAEVLTANRSLTIEERQLIQSHPVLGASKLSKFSYHIQDVAKLHHESPDGSGYPYGRKSIPLLPSIVHIVDMYDAMCRQRDYKKPYDRTYVRNFIETKLDIFDKDIVDAFLASSKLFLPGETLFISGIPCIMCDYKDGLYSFYSEGVGRCLFLSDEEVKTQLSWQSSMLN